jgi:hypothetical protein
MARLFDRIRDIFRPQQAQPEQTTVDWTAQEMALHEESLARKFIAESERTKVVRACREMYRIDPRTKRMITRLARDMTKGGYAIRTNNPTATDAATGLYNRLKLAQVLDDWVRLTARDGDSFLELEINDALEITSVSRKPTLYVHRASNEFDRFEQPERAFWMANGVSFGTEPPKTAVWFAQWQMIHARWEHDEGKRYGTPLLESAIGAYKKVSEGEMDVSVRRKARSGMRYLHVVEGADEAALRKYKAENQAALQATGAVSDFFTNKPASISAIQGDGHLGEIEDVQHHIATLFTAGEVPMELIGYGEDLNRDVLGPKQEAYNESLEQLREWVVSELLQPLVERQLLLLGYFPESLELKITWKSKAAITAKEILDVADAAMRLRILGLPQERIWDLLARFVPGVDAETLAAEVDPADTDPSRFSNILAGFGGG